MVNDHEMTSEEWKMFKHDEKAFNLYGNNRFYCLCGHSVTMPPKETRVLCSYCGYWVYRDKKQMFKERLKVKLNENTVNGN